MFFTINEIIDVVIMTLAIGYIFSTFIKRAPRGGYDPLLHYSKNRMVEDTKQGIVIAAPAIVLHELAHKFVAMAFGATAVLHAPIGWYVAVVVMRMLNFPFLFFVGGYVTHTPLPPLESALVAISGPLMNLMLFILSKLFISLRLIGRRNYFIADATAKLNLFLFVFNLIPIPGFDGFNFVSNIMRLFF
ncbi:hypothetical protein JXC34_06865 [Candidatus Woesearchaeota archaeon]|nr:hypothetical protein [Candidatus Woesearchaeota archaeon]